MERGRLETNGPKTNDGCKKVELQVGFGTRALPRLACIRVSSVCLWLWLAVESCLRLPARPPVSPRFAARA